MQDRQKAIIQNVLERKLIAIVRGVGPEQIIQLGEALTAGGINMIEVTFDQSASDGFAATADSIKALSKSADVFVGAGTVLTKEQVDIEYQAGAGYIITPTVDCDVIRHVKELGMVAMPGAMTPTEILTAYQAGADFVKVFPAGDLGASYIKSVLAPLKQIPLLAVGGVNEKNIPDFLAAGVKGVGIGGNLVNKTLVKEGQFDKITELAKLYVSALSV